MKKDFLRLFIGLIALSFFAGAYGQRHEPLPKHRIQADFGVTKITSDLTTISNLRDRAGLIDEDFSSGVFPPEGWAIIGDGQDNWIVSETNAAGGESPEARLQYAPVFDGNSKLASTAVNTSGMTALLLSFKHYLNDYVADYTIKVETSSDGINWNEAWSLYIAGGDVGPEAVLVGIDNADVGSETFQIAFTYDGNSDFTDGWSIDDVLLEESLEKDVAPTSIGGIDIVNDVGIELTPTADVFNYGSETVSFDVNIRINDGTSDVYTSTATITDLGSTESATATFDSWTTSVEGQFTVYVTSMLNGDENPDNDEISYSFSVLAGTLLFQDFTNGAGDWQVMGDGEANWNVLSSNAAGGSIPELAFSYSPIFDGVSRFVSPVVDASAYTEFSLEFRQYLDLYAGGYNLKIETTSDGGTSWNEIWAIYDVQEGIDAEFVVLGFSNDDVGSETFQLAYTFEGNSDFINSWHIDDIVLREPPQSDVTPYGITGFVPMMNVDEEVLPGVTVKNLSGNTVTFDIKMTINNGSDDVYESIQAMDDLAGFEEMTVGFDSWITEVGNMEATVVTMLDGDENTANDTTTYNFTVIDGVFRNMVVAEDFTGAWCGYCPGAAMGIDDLLHLGYDVAAIAFHNGDPYVTEESAAREDFYEITGFPTVKFDGVQEFIGGSATESMIDNYIPIVEDRMAMPTPIKVDLEDVNFDGTTFTADVNINPVSIFPEGEIVLYAVITESHIDYAWQTQFEMNHVDRAMFNGANGYPLDLSGGQQIVPIEFTLDVTWVPELCEVVVYVQHTATKEVFNADKVEVKEIEKFADVNVTAVDNNGSALEGVLVHFGELSELTNTEGQVTFADVEPGPYLFSYGKAGYLPGLSSTKVVRLENLEFNVELILANIIFSEDFADTNNWPPVGWELTGDLPDNWYQSETAAAGGTAPELMFSWYPATIGESDFITPVVDLTGRSNASLILKQYVSNYQGETAEDYELFILASTGDGWNTLWSTIPKNIDPEILQIELGEEYLTAGSIQIAFRFSGDSDKINNWNLDDVWVVEEITEVATYKAAFNVTDLDGGNPIANATITISGFDAVTTDAEGKAMISGLADGTYSYTVIATDYIEVSGNLTVNGSDISLGVEMQTTGINEELARKIKIYPNPAKNTLWIENLDKANIRIYSIVGALVINDEGIYGKYKVDLSFLQNGNYIIKISEGGAVMTSRVSIVK